MQKLDFNKDGKLVAILYYIYCIYQIFILTLPQRYNKR